MQNIDEVLEYVKPFGYSKVIQYEDYNGQKVFNIEREYDGDESHYTGFPIFILIKDGDPRIAKPLEASDIFLHSNPIK